MELHGLEQSQRALLSNIETSLTAVQSAQTDLAQKSQLPQLGSDPVSFVPTCWVHRGSNLSPALHRHELIIAGWRKK